MPNIYTSHPAGVCSSYNCTPTNEYFHEGEVTLCEHNEIYFCHGYVSKYDDRSESAKNWKKLSPLWNPWKYDKAERLLRTSVQPT